MLSNFLEIKALLFSLTYWARYIQGQEKKKKADQFQILNPPPQKKEKEKNHSEDLLCDISVHQCKGHVEALDVSAKAAGEEQGVNFLEQI